MVRLGGFDPDRPSKYINILDLQSVNFVVQTVMQKIDNGRDIQHADCVEFIAETQSLHGAPCRSKARTRNQRLAALWDIRAARHLVMFLTANVSPVRANIRKRAHLNSALFCLVCRQAIRYGEHDDAASVTILRRRRFVMQLLAVFFIPVLY